MGKTRNIKYQFKYCIDTHFREGMDKHSMKRNGKDNSKIYSYADRKNLIDLSANFANWIKENHAEIKQLKDIDSKHIQEFLNEKANSCSRKSLQEYQSHFRKLESLCNNTYKTNVDFHSTVTPISIKNGGGKIRNIMCSDAQYQSLLKTTNSNLKSALILSKNFGLRASECSKIQYKDIKEDGIYIADSKGKRSRFIKAENGQQQEILQQLREKKQGRICPVQTGSLQQAFNRECKKQGIHFPNGAFHTLRKNFATAKYKEYRKKGETVQQALDSVSHALGHGSNRNQLMKEYICCPLE
jgi:integrase